MSDVPAGWVSIVERLLPQLRAAGVIELDQVKQKFGGLRVYVGRRTPGTPYSTVEALIQAAAAEAAQTCEVCGGPGTLRHDYHFIQTLCDEHAAARATHFTAGPKA